jgi:hypothetical protein
MGRSGSLLGIDRAPVAFPVACGQKNTGMVRLSPGGTKKGASDTVNGSSLTLRLPTLSAAVPVFVTTRSCCAQAPV